MAVLLIATLTAMCFASLVYYCLDTVGGDAASESRKIEQRLGSLIKNRSSDIETRTSFSTIVALNQVFRRQKIVHRLNYLLDLMGWNVSFGVFLFGDLLVGVIAYLFFRAIDFGVVSFVMGAAAAAVPLLILKLNYARYIAKFTAVFPDSLTMMKNAIKAGQGIQSAFQLVAEEGPQPVCHEFAALMREVELGSSLGEALSNLHHRISTTDTRIFVLGIFIQQEVGGNIAELFAHIEETIRERISMTREMSALAAQGKMTGIVLILLPFGVAAVMKAFNPTYFDPLLESPQGIHLIKMVGVMMCIGAFIIHQMTSPSIVK